MTSAVLDRDFYLVPQESNLSDIQRAFSTDDPPVNNETPGGKMKDPTRKANRSKKRTARNE
jgi:hypothetical protein